MYAIIDFEGLQVKVVFEQLATIVTRLANVIGHWMVDWESTALVRGNPSLRRRIWFWDRHLEIQCKTQTLKAGIACHGFTHRLHPSTVGFAY